jgi:type IV secretory pathway TrbF-like protein
MNLILALGIGWMSARRKVVPFVIEVDKLGYAITIPSALTPERERIRDAQGTRSRIRYPDNGLSEIDFIFR